MVKEEIHHGKEENRSWVKGQHYSQLRTLGFWGTINIPALLMEGNLREQ